MSAGPDHGPPSGRLPQRDPHGGLLPRRIGLLAVWALLTAVAAISWIAGRTPWSGELEALVPAAHRTSGGRTLVMLRVDAEALAAEGEIDSGPDAEPNTEIDSGLDAATILAEAGFAIEEAFPDERVPLAPPKTEITRWLDAHALYLLPIDTHAALAERLTDAAMLAQVQSLGARLSSPLYSVSGDQARRDPLAISELTANEAGRLGHVAEIPGADAPRVGANGDLISASGDRALIALVTSRTPEELQPELEAALARLPVTIELIDPSLQSESVATWLGDAWKLLLGGCLAGLVLLLAPTLRQVLPVLVLVGGLGSGWLLVTWLGPLLGLAGFDLLSLALSVVLLGFCCDAALRVPEVGARGWASTLILAGALVPLWLSPYPLWQRWAVVWPIACLLLALGLRALVPVVLGWLRGGIEWRRSGFRAAPRPIVAALACVGLCAGAIWLAPKLHYRSLARIPLVDDEQRLRERELSEHFFEPSMIVEVRTSADEERESRLGSREAAVLDAAAESISSLAELVPTEARRVDSPASFVLPQAELEARKQALAKLNLGERMEVLQLMLADRGLRAEAFSEFVHGTTDIEDLPSAAAALDGPLGPWIRGYMATDADGAPELRSRIELRGRDGLPVASLSDARLAELPPLRGPAVAAMIDRRELASRIGVVLVCGWWLTALLIWLATRELAGALAAVLAAASSQAGLVVALALLEQPIGPPLLPIFLLVGASAGLTGARACKAVALGQPIAEPGLLVSTGCQIVVGLALFGVGQPLWRELGLALALGSALACVLGMFITPGLATLLSRRPRSEGSA